MPCIPQLEPQVKLFMQMANASGQHSTRTCFLATSALTLPRCVRFGLRSRETCAASMTRSMTGWALGRQLSGRGEEAAGEPEIAEGQAHSHSPPAWEGSSARGLPGLRLLPAGLDLSVFLNGTQHRRMPWVGTCMGERKSIVSKLADQWLPGFLAPESRFGAAAPRPR